MRKGFAGLAAVLAALGVAAGPATAGNQDTTSGTIELEGNRLKPGHGEGHYLREELATAHPERDKGRRDLVFAAQMSDAHVIDEESPLRVEFTDKFGGIFTSAYRPQEGLGPHVLNQMVDRLDDVESPIAKGRRLDAVVTTGDNTDSGQCNETRWMIDVMTGGRSVNPDSGHPQGTLGERDLCLGEGPQVHAPVPPGCDGVKTGPYDGVRGGEYYEPDGGGDGPYENLRNFPGLFDVMNQAFTAEGFADDGIKWYAVFGNHDGLIQGNQPRNPGFEAIGVGCVKVTGLSNVQEAAVRNAPSEQAAMAQVLRSMQDADPTGPLAELIEPDPRRRPLRKTEWINEHLVNSDYGHGFNKTNLASGTGNYSFRPVADERVRFVALDTVAEHGLEEGNLDDAQFQWLHDTLLAAEEAGERVVVFAHHSLQSMGQPPISPFLPGDTLGNLDPNVHYGNGPRPSGQKLPCLTAERTAPTYPEETLRCLLLRHPSVVAFVNGHEHNNRIDPITYVDHDPVKGENRGFWEINTASHIDWPQQSRLLDIVDNPDETLSIFGTLVDHDSSEEPGADGPRTPDPKQLASISRELSAFEHQSHSDPEHNEGSRGGEKDRNVELLIRDPFPGGGEGS